jgi:anti-sigma regulatory factor (Ser/Thr protein kinase)
VTAYSPERSEVELELPAEPASVTEARRAVSELAGRLGAPEDDVRLAVSEAVGNAVIHAFKGRKPGTVVVRVRHSRDRLLVTVADDGVGMIPNVDSPGLGVGISLITHVAKDVRFDSSDSGTTVSMSFDADPGGRG